MIAFDYGLARIGVATGNRLTVTASPVATLTARGELPWAEVDSIVREWRPGMLVVGMPSADEDKPLVQRIRGFVEALRARYDLPVETVDESHTSVEASVRLRDQRAQGVRRRRVRKEAIDRHAACLIAERWMRGEE